MTSISLASYFVTVCRAGDRTSLRLDDFDGKKGDLFALATRTLTRLAKWPYQDRDAGKLVRLRDVPRVLKDERRIEGVLESGEFGYEASLLDIDDLELRYQRQVGDAELLPLYFLLAFPKKSEKGYAILQRFGSYGAKRALEAVLTADLPQGIGLLWSAALPFKVVKEWTEVNQAKSIRFVQHTVRKDWAESIGLKKPEEVSAEIVLRAKPRKSFRLPGGRSRLPEDFVELQERWPHDQIKIQADIGGRTRTFDTREPRASMRAFCDITEDVDWQADGHPTFASLQREAHELLEQLERTQQVRPGQATSPKLRELALKWLESWRQTRLRTT